jgi:MarR family transcriptional regulator, organic hydroperoxide resistance regulator
MTSSDRTPAAPECSGEPTSVTAQGFDSAIAAAVLDGHPDIDAHVLRAATNLKRAATILDQTELQQLHSLTGCTTAAFRVLVIIWTFGPVEAKDVARLSGVSRQAVSSVLATLERDGLVHRERATKADKRLVPITVTGAGRALVDQHLGPQNKIQAAFFHALSSEELDIFVGLLTRLIVAAHDQR